MKYISISKPNREISRFGLRILIWRVCRKQTGGIWYSGTNKIQGSFCVCDQPMRNNVTMLHRLSLAGRVHKIIPKDLMQICLFIARTMHKQFQSWSAQPHTYQVSHSFNTLRPRQNGRHFPEDIFKWIFLNENVWILIIFSLKFVPQGSNNNIPALVQIMTWRRPGDKPLSEPRMIRFLTHICVTQPQWVNDISHALHQILP